MSSHCEELIDLEDEDPAKELARLTKLLGKLQSRIAVLQDELDPSIAKAAAKAAVTLAITATSKTKIYAPLKLVENAEIVPTAETAKSDAIEPLEEQLNGTTPALVVTDEPQNTAELMPYQIYCDRLTFIKGMDLKAAKILANLGVTRFVDIAAFTAEDITEIEVMLSAPGRISKQGWIEQAALLADGTMTRFALKLERAAVLAPISVTVTAKIETAADTASTENVASSADQSMGNVIQLDNQRLAAAQVAKQAQAAATLSRSASRAKRWSTLAATIALFASVAVLGKTVSENWEHWQGALQNMASLLV